MIALYLSPLYILVNAYVVRWLLRWMGACSRLFQMKGSQMTVITLYILLASSLGIGFLLPNNRLGRAVKLVGNYWLGVMLYVILAIVAADLVRILLKHCSWVNQDKLGSRQVFVAAGAVCILVIAGISLWGAYNARVIRTTRYQVEIPKNGGNLSGLKVVLVADLHLGYNIGSRHMERMVKKINGESPDLVVIAGDIFDNDYDSLDNPDRLISIFRKIQSKYGIYACYGNHDIKEKILAGFTFHGKNEKKESDPRMDEFLDKAGICLLMDEGVLIQDSFYLYGRPDAGKPGRNITERKTAAEITAEMDLSKPVLVMDHEPKELAELAAAGVDLDLCGHTHDGQLFPGNIMTAMMWENSCGYLKKDNMHNIVTSGVGLFGPNMRVGTIAEICSIEVKFTGKNQEKPAKNS